MLQHARRLRDRRRRRVRVAGLLAGMTALVAAGCERSPRTIWTPDPPEVAMAVAIDEASELGDACPSALDACGTSLTASCRVSCQPSANGCANVWELYRLQLGPSALQGTWLGFDADGQH